MSEDVIVLEPGDERAKKIGKAMSSPTSGEIISLLQSGDMTLSDITDKLGIPMTTAKYHVENLLDSGMIEVRRIKYSEKGREVKVYGASGQVVIVSAGNRDLRSLLLKYASVFGLLILASLFVIGISGVIPGMISSDINQGSYPDAAYFYSPGYDDSEALPAAAVSENYSGGGGGYSDSGVTEGPAVPEPVIAKGAVPPEMPQGGQKSEVQAYAAAYENGSEVQVEVVSGDAAGKDTGDLGAAMLTARSADADSGFAGASDNSGDNSRPSNLVHMIVLSFFSGGCLVLVVLMLYEALIWRKEKIFWQEYNSNSKKYTAYPGDNKSDDRSSKGSAAEDSEPESESEQAHEP